MTETPNPNATILADLQAKASKHNALSARLFGEPTPGPDAEGERIKPTDDTQEDPT